MCALQLVLIVGALFALTIRHGVSSSRNRTRTPGSAFIARTMEDCRHLPHNYKTNVPTAAVRTKQGILKHELWASGPAWMPLKLFSWMNRTGKSRGKCFTALLPNWVTTDWLTFSVTRKGWKGGKDAGKPVRNSQSQLKITIRQSYPLIELSYCKALHSKVLKF